MSELCKFVVKKNQIIMGELLKKLSDIFLVRCLTILQL